MSTAQVATDSTPAISQEEARIIRFNAHGPVVLLIMAISIVDNYAQRTIRRYALRASGYALRFFPGYLHRQGEGWFIRVSDKKWTETYTDEELLNKLFGTYCYVPIKINWTVDLKQRKLKLNRPPRGTGIQLKLKEGVVSRLGPDGKQKKDGVRYYFTVE